MFCLVLFSFDVLNRSLERWFTNPVDNQVKLFVNAAQLLRREMQDEVDAQAALLGRHGGGPQGLDGRRSPGGIPGALRQSEGARLGDRLRARRRLAARVWTAPDAADAAAAAIALALSRAGRRRTTRAMSNWSRRCRSTWRPGLDHPEEKTTST